MSKEKHTLGPWKAEWSVRDVNGYSGWHVLNQNKNGVIADIPDGHFDDEKEANARLIAAAPEMLAELEGIGHQTQITTEHFNRIQRLIAKAKGE